MAKDSMTISAADLDEAVQGCVSRCQLVAEEREFGGFTAPELDRAAFERIDGAWTRTFRFTFEFLPPRES
jgi:hypothetical protein